MNFRNSCKLFVAALSVVLIALGQNVSRGALPPSTTIQFPKKFSAVVVAPDNQTFAVVTPFVFEKRKYSSLAIWSVASAKKLRAWSVSGGMTSLPSFSSNGELMVGASADGKIRLWDATAGVVRQEILLAPFLGEAHSVVLFKNNSKLLIGGSGNENNKGAQAVIYDLSSRVITRLGTNFPAFIDSLSVAATTDGEHLAATYMFWYEDHDTRESYLFWQQFLDFYRPSVSLKPLKEGGVDASMLGDSRTQIYPMNLNFSRDGQILVAQLGGGTVQMWETRTGGLLKSWRTFSYGGNAFDPITTLSLDSEGKYLTASTENGMLYLWTFPEGDRLISFKAHQKKILAAAYSQRDKTLISASDDGTVKIWRIP